MAEGFYKRVKQSISKSWSDWDILDLLLRIDRGHRPTDAEASVLKSREALDLHFNNLAALPASIGQLKNLKTLDLGSTRLTALPDSLGQLANLKYLDLQYTPLAALPESIGQLASLRYLYLSDTRLTTLPESIGQPARLRILDLGNTRLAALPESVGQLASLQTLDLSNTNLAALPESVGQLASLQRLDLGNTRLATLPESVGQLASLQGLDLGNTRLAALPDSLGQLASLQVLSLRNTRLAALPEWLGELPELEYLDLRGLTLPRLPRSLARRGLPFVETDGYDFKGVNLYGVTLTEQDKAVFLQNDPALIAGLYEAAEQRSLRECRVIFLGDGDSGKSYTIRRFRNKGQKETAAQPYLTRETPGVEILDQRVRFNGNRLTLHFWDFGGQEILHAMHRCFLSEDSCYVVTVKSRETKADRRARYWLRNVTAFAPRSPILLYVNCWDNDSGRRVLDEPRLIRDFPMISKVVYVSAKEAEDDVFQRELMNPLIKMAAGSNGCNRTVNRRWKAVRDAIEAESREKDYLTKERYHALCAANGVEDENAPALLSYFNSLGVCFSYHRDENKQELADYRLLQPVWLTNAIYAIIEEGMGRAEEGRIAVQEVVRLLCGRAPQRVRERDYRRTVPELVYREDECSYILDVAVLHKLCYRIDGETLFFPALCSTDSPPEAMAEPGEGLRRMEYRLQYSYLPDNVIHRLMIRCMQQDYAVERCWLRGLILNHAEGPRVLVRMDDDETLRIDLWANPARPAHLIFLGLREEILRINGELGLKARELIVDGEDRYSVISLLRAWEKRSSVFGSVSGTERDAGDLLGDFYESRILEDMRVEGSSIVIPILPYEYHPCKPNDPELKIALYEAYRHICPYCGKPLQSCRETQVDHIFPSKYQDRPELAEYVKYLNAHGFDTEKPDYVENYFPAHSSCNRDKSNHTEPFALLAWHHRAARMAPTVLRLMEKRKWNE